MTLLLNCLETRVDMKPVDQTNKVWKSNTSWNFDNISFMSIVITQLILIVNNRVIKI